MKSYTAEYKAGPQSEILAKLGNFVFGEISSIKFQLMENGAVGELCFKVIYKELIENDIMPMFDICIFTEDSGTIYQCHLNNVMLSCGKTVTTNEVGCGQNYVFAALEAEYTPTHRG